MSSIRNFLTVYMSRHAHPADRALHMLGVPLAPWGAFVLLALGHYWAAAGAFIGGYLLQWIGHRIEGSHMGDWDMFVGALRLIFRLGRPRAA